MSAWTEYEEPVGYASPLATRPRGEAADNEPATQEAEFQASGRAHGGSVMAPELLAHASLTDAMTEQERIGDTDERQRVHNTATLKYRWICSLDVTWPGNDEDHFARGSGVLVGPKQVLTAAHCIYRTIDLWQSTTGDRVKDRSSGSAQPLRLPSPGPGRVAPPPTAVQAMAPVPPTPTAGLAEQNGHG